LDLGKDFWERMGEIGRKVSFLCPSTGLLPVKGKHTGRLRDPYVVVIDGQEKPEQRRPTLQSQVDDDTLPVQHSPQVSSSLDTNARKE